MNLTGQSVRPKEPKPVRDKAYLDRIRSMPCVICGRFPSEAHHCIHERFSQAKVCDYETIPLCADHHRDLHHEGKKTWAKQYGPDYGFLDHVRAEMGREEDGIFMEWFY